MSNEAKFVRRLASCYLEIGKILEADRILHELDRKAGNSALTWLLRVRIDLRHASDDKVSTSIDALVNSEDFYLPFLYHCAVEAQHLGRSEISLAILTSILAKADKTSPDPEVRLLAVLRCTIKSLIHRLDTENHDSAVIESLCQQFETAAALVSTRELSALHGMNNKELDWFSKTAYNTAVTNSTTWSSKYISRILTSCNSVRRNALPTVSTK